MFSIRPLRTAALAAGFMHAALPAAAKPVFTSFDPPGSGSTSPASINSAGTVAGSYADKAGTHGFIRSADGTFTEFDAPGSTATQVFGMNDAGAVVGQFTDKAGVHCFVRDISGVITAFDGPPGEQYCRATGINAKGEIAGYAFEGGDTATAYLRTAQGKVKAITGISGDSEATSINTAGAVTGSVSTNSLSPGFVRTKNGGITTFDAPGDVNGTVPQSINAKGAIAGYYFDSASADHSFVRAPSGAITVFDPPGSHISVAFGINARGEVVGAYDGNGFLGYVRSASGKFQSIAAPGGSEGTFPRGINDMGAVTGSYVDDQDGQRGFVWTP